MANEDEPPSSSTTRAEFMLQYLLERQLATSGRLERVEFQRSKQPDETTDFSSEVTTKRRRYGAEPSSVALAEQQQNAGESDERPPETLGRHERELESSLVEGKSRLRHIAHLSMEAPCHRKPLIELSEACKGTTPQERVRRKADKSRSAAEVFAASAPPLLDMKSYLEYTAYDTTQEQVPEKVIHSNRFSPQELREWCNGKFKDHQPGGPSKTLYIKNLSSEVTDGDLKALFLRYKRPGKPIGFRLMQKGRMKGQAFVTFQDETTAAQALNLVNGYLLKGKPMVLQYARGPDAQVRLKPAVAQVERTN